MTFPYLNTWSGNLAWVQQKLRVGLVRHAGSSFLIEVGKSFQNVQIHHHPPPSATFHSSWQFCYQQRRRRCGIHISAGIAVLTAFSVALDWPEQCEKSPYRHKEALGACNVRQTLYTSRDQDRETTWDTPPVPPHSHVGCKDEV